MANEDEDTESSRKRFWAEQLRRVSETDISEFKSQQLPLARIKRIMKADEDVRMISAEAPVIFAKACELFILDLTMRAWEHTKTTKRRTLQKCDVASAIEQDDMFDFLVDIVPREAPVVMPAGMSNTDYFQYQQHVQAQLQNAALAQQAVAFQTPADAAAVAAAQANAAAAAAGFVQQQMQASPFANFPQAAVAPAPAAAASSSSSSAALAHIPAAAASSAAASALTPAPAASADPTLPLASTSISSSSLAGSSSHPQNDQSAATTGSSHSPSLVADSDMRMHDAKLEAAAAAAQSSSRT